MECVVSNSRWKSSGSKRMVESGKKKVEVWLSAAQMKAFAELAEQLGLPVATLARRAMNYASGGGFQAMRCLNSEALD